MDARDLARIAYYRRWLRPDWRRWLHPDWERRVNPAEREAMRKDFALRDLAFETPMARRWREQNEAREREEQERLQAEIEREALAMKAELASLRVELVWAELRWKAECAERKRRADIAWERFKAAFMRGDFASRYKAFDPNQPRVPAGNSIPYQPKTMKSRNPDSEAVGTSGRLDERAALATANARKRPF